MLAGERPHKKADECVHDILKRPQTVGSSEASEPGQQDGQQNPW